jgi:hypothetical protein
MFCPECGTENDSQQGFCRHCGLPLAGARLALERRFDQLLVEIEASRLSLRRARTFVIAGLIWAVFAALFFLFSSPFTTGLASSIIAICIFLSLAAVFAVKSFKRINVAHRHLSAKEEASGPLLGGGAAERAALSQESARNDIDAVVQVPNSIAEHTTLDLGPHHLKR